jgi:uroporphyrin-III C-methyltransferase
MQPRNPKSNIKMTISPKITLVGAGPGDPELITLKGLRALRSADVVLYDALACGALLEEAPPEALRVYVGKRAGKHTLRQEEINRLLVQFSSTYGHVVRLKGGDPFVFGRGWEELEYARRCGIEVEVVPGISSATGVPAGQEVPLTSRGVSESFWVLTGTTRSGDLTGDLRLAAQSNATLVILMGIHRLAEIMELLSAFGKAETPAMVVQDGTTPHEKSVTGTVGDIASLAEKAGVGSPGIIVVGNVVGLHRAFGNSLREELTFAEAAK